eukprot:TRINITY_DN2297_c0_g1_i1.p1 TRINITY_DN2297_c0_g1~~TRINITY_DN2297_c0_g1_i1.p1  ORF type:complete len:170 (-),score=31.63 TRINITY_DN2297_c0_g1_i1:55-531(-)
MGNKQANIPPRPPITNPNKTRICVAGYELSAHFRKARNVAHRIQQVDPEQFETWYFSPSREQYFEYLQFLKDEDFGVPPEWKTSPIVWFERVDGIEIIGGRHELCEWTKENELMKDTPAAKLAGGSVMSHYFTVPAMTVGEDEGVVYVDSSSDVMECD